MEPTEKPPILSSQGMYSLSPGPKKEPSSCPARSETIQASIQACELLLHSRLGSPPTPRLHGPQDRTVTPTQQKLQDSTLQTTALRLTERLYLPQVSQFLIGKLATSLVTDTFLCSTCILLTENKLPRDRACAFCVPGTRLGLRGALECLLSLITIIKVLKTYLPACWLTSGDSDFSNCPSHPCQAEGLAETCESHGCCGRREELWVMPQPHGQHLFRSLNQAGRPSLLPSTFSEDQAGNSHLADHGKRSTAVVLNPGFQQEGFENVQVPGALLQSIQVRILDNGMG